MPDTSKPGFFPASFTPAMISRLRSLSEPRWAADGSAAFVLETHDGRADLLLLPLDGSPTMRLTSDPAPAPAGAYAGGFYTVRDDALAFTGADGGLWLLPLPRGGQARRLRAGEGSVSAPAFSPDGKRVAYVSDDGKASHIGVADASGGEWPRRVPVEADFAIDPAWSPDGKRLAWVEWSVPHMGWDQSRVVIYELETGNRSVVMDEPEVSCSQPHWSPSGNTLTFLCDKTGYLNLWRANGDGSDPAVWVEEAYEHGGPQWSSGASTYVWAPDGRHIALSRNDDGYWRPRLLDVNEAEGTIYANNDLWADGLHSSLRWAPRGTQLLALRHGAALPPTVVAFDVATGRERALYTVATGGLTGEGMVWPESLTWRASDGLTIHGLLYRPKQAADEQSKAPLLIYIHGGPTSQTPPDWNLPIQYFVQRGWGVLAVNVRGSTGYGRAYAQALRNEWGGADMSDIVAGVEAVVARGWADGSRVVPWGGSAGGYAVLRLLAAYPERFKAGVSLYGVTDLFHLARTTHRLEAHYLDRIVGYLPEAAARYHEWSPGFHTDRFQTPVLLLQGEKDKVVPAEQATTMSDALKRAGKTVELEVYPGEGHGWAKAATISAYLTRMERFLEQYVLLM
ncbi:MAG TPA: S9 family peptidase [Ktedonobacterales bacterium]